MSKIKINLDYTVENMRIICSEYNINQNDFKFTHIHYSDKGFYTYESKNIYIRLNKFDESFLDN